MNKNIIVSSQLYYSGKEHPNGIMLDIKNFEDCFNKLKNMDKREITVYDIVYSTKVESNKTIIVNDHINCSGINPLIGKQKFLGIDFIDMTNVYKKENSGVVAYSCGEKILPEFKYPCAFLACFVILCRALQFKTIYGRLINY